MGLLLSGTKAMLEALKRSDSWNFQIAIMALASYQEV